jgi:predicted house-cleaning noncanonical NTP pyrophosphatase (MazG superfamily)
MVAAVACAQDQDPLTVLSNELLSELSELSSDSSYNPVETYLSAIQKQIADLVGDFD